MRPWLPRVLVAALVVLPVGCVLGDEQTQHQSFSVGCFSTAKDPKDLGLRRATLRTVDDGVEVTWTTSRPMTRLASYWVNLTDDYGVMRRQLYVSINTEDELFEALGLDPHIVAVQDRREGTSYLDGEPEVVGSSVRMVFPHSTFERREGSKPFHWYAGIDLNSDDEKHDTCPDPRANDDWPIPPPGPLPT